MALETANFIDGLVVTNPVGATDVKSQGDDHLRLLKTVLKANFPSATRAVYFESAAAAKTSAYSVLVTDENALVRADVSGGAFTVTLPLGSNVFAGFTVTIGKSDSGSNNVTVDGNGAETINGVTTRTLYSQFHTEMYMWDGAEWKIQFAYTDLSGLAVGDGLQSNSGNLRVNALHERKTNDYTALAADRARIFEMDKATAVTLNLTAAATLGEGWFIHVHNSGAGTLTIDPNSAELINDAATITLATGSGVTIFCDGSAFWTTGGADKGTLPRSYLAGLTLSNGTDATNDINVAVGEARSTANDKDLTVATAIGKQIDASWATGGTTGTPTGGLSSTLTLANDTWYHVIAGLVSDSIEIGFDTSITGANLVTDHSFTNTRRIGAVKRLTAANRAFTQTGDKVILSDPPLSVDTSSQSTTAVLYPLEVPLGIKIEVHGTFYTTDASTGVIYLSSPDANDEAPSNSAAPLSNVHARASEADTGNFSALTDTSSRVRVRATVATDTFRLATLWYIDRRGRDD